MKTLSLSAAGILAAMFSLSVSTVCQARDLYRLGPGDILQLSVLGVSEFGRRVTVNVDGDVSVPFLGEVHAEGLTIHDLRIALADGLTKDGHIQSPDVTVEMVEHRPFYISGDVSRPGAVPYRPGLDVRHAIAIAGGYDALRFRTENPLMMAPDLQSENKGLWIDFVRLQARAVTLKSELKGADDADFSGIYSAPLPRRTLDEIASFEENDLKMRLSNYAKQRSFLENALKDTQANIVALMNTQARNSESLKLQQDAVDRMMTSASKGLVSATRVDDERRALSEIRSQQGDAESRLVVAQKEQVETTRNIEQQDEQHQQQLNDSLREATLEAEKLAARIKGSSEKLLYAGAVKQQLRGDDGGPELVIYRKVGGETTKIPATQDTEVLPDDMLEVNIRTDQMMGAPNSQ